jgi:hypothetical protein
LRCFSANPVKCSDPSGTCSPKKSKMRLRFKYWRCTTIWPVEFVFKLSQCARGRSDEMSWSCSHRRPLPYRAYCGRGYEHSSRRRRVKLVSAKFSESGVRRNDEQTERLLKPQRCRKCNAVLASNCCRCRSRMPTPNPANPSAF